MNNLIDKFNVLATPVINYIKTHCSELREKFVFLKKYVLFIYHTKCPIYSIALANLMYAILEFQLKRKKN